MIDFLGVGYVPEGSAIRVLKLAQLQNVGSPLFHKQEFPEDPVNPTCLLNRVYPVQFVYDSGAHFTGVPFQGVQPVSNNIKGG